MSGAYTSAESACISISISGDMQYTTPFGTSVQTSSKVTGSDATSIDSLALDYGERGSCRRSYMCEGGLDGGDRASG